MSKSPDAFRTISEVAEWLGVQAHVLRFWESKFTQVKPVKRAGGRRYYRPADMMLLGGIKKLLHGDGLTIKGVQKMLREQGVAHVSELSQSLDETAPMIDVTPPEQGPKVVRFKDPSPATEPPVDMPAAIVEEPQFNLNLEPVAQHPINEPVPHDAEIEDLPALDVAASNAETSEPEPAEPDAAEIVAPEAEDDAPILAEAAAEPEPDVALPSALIPDPPAADELPYTPGSLARLARLDRLTPDLAREIAPLAQELRQWHDRATNMGTG